MRTPLCSFLSFVVMVASPFAFATDFIHGDSFDAVVDCPAGETPSVAAAQTPGARATTLGTRNTFIVLVRSCGYAGNVTLTPKSAPAGWTVTADPNGFALVSGGSRTALVTADIATSGAAGNFAVGVDAVGPNLVSPTSQLDAANMFLVTIAANTGDNLHPLLDGIIHLRVGTTLRIASEDTTTDHVVHAVLNAIPGFNHQYGTGVTPGNPYDMTSTGMGSDTIYCHNHGPSPGYKNVYVDQM